MALPLVEIEVVIAGQAFRVHAARDQDALLAATADRAQVPFGLMLWESAVVLAETLAGDGALLAGKRVLELGAGVGLAGIVAAAHGAVVEQTDYDALAVEVCRDNARRNGVDGRTSQVIADWRTWQPEARYDLIIGADVLYDADDLQPIARVMTEALAPGGTVVLSDPDRPGTTAFVDRLKTTGWVVEIAQHSTPDLTRPGRILSVQVIAARRA
jgi:predicted nicotinamide N-methyase